MPLTLQEFMPKQLQEDIFTSVTCYLIDEEESLDIEEEIVISHMQIMCSFNHVH